MLSQLGYASDKDFMHTRTVNIAVLGLAAVLLVGCSNSEADKQKYFASGNSFFEQKKYNEAIVEYRNAIKEDGRFGEARFKLAESYANLGNARAAYPEYIRAADLLPENSEAQLKAVNYLIVSNQFEDARTRVERLLAREPRNVDGQILLGRALAGLKDLPAAIAEVEEAIQIDPLRADAYTSLASLKLAQGQRDQARAAFEKAVDVAPEAINPRLSLAYFQWGVGDTAEAEGSFKKALSLEPANRLTNRALATFYMSTGRAPEAEPFLKLASIQGGIAEKISLAGYYVSLRRYDDARATLKPIAESDGADATAAQIRLAEVDYASNQRASGHSRVDAALARDPKNFLGLLTKATWLFAEGKIDEAKVPAEAAVAVNDQSARAHYLVGLIQIQKRDVAGATASFTKVLQVNPRATPAQVQLSRLSLAAGNSSQAIDFAQQSLANAPRNADAHLSLARGFLAQRELDKAKPEITLLLQEFPNSAAVHSINGLHRLLSKDVAGARAAYERAATLDPNALEPLAGLTTIDAMEKRYEAARQRVESRLATSPKRADYHQLAARVYMSMPNRSADAEQSLRRAIDLDPANMTSYSLLGQLYVSQRKLDQALAEFGQIAKRNPKDVGSRTMVGTLLMVQNKNQEAIAQYKEVLQIDSRAAVSANNLAWLYAESGQNLDEALTLAQRAAEVLPDSTEIRDTLGWVYFKKELPELALRAFEQNVAKEPGNPIFQYHLGMAHAKRGDLGRAKQAFEAALKIQPGYQDAQRGLKSVAG